MTKLIFTALVAICLAGPARPDPLTDALFSEHIFEALPVGHAITYSHGRSGSAVSELKLADDGRIFLETGTAANGTPSLTMTIEQSDKKREIIDFPASGGNPVLMVFLESTVRSIAAMSGGSPFYIQNRIKDALRQGGDLVAIKSDFAGASVAAQEVILRPFVADTNRERLGDLADLTLRFVVADAVPGRFLSLSADTPKTPSGYHETITLTDVSEVGQ